MSVKRSLFKKLLQSIRR